MAAAAAAPAPATAAAPAAPAPAEEPPLRFRNFRPDKPSRPATKERKHGDVLKALTIRLVDTYGACSQEFKYTLQLAPRRVLTKLSKGVHNNGHDNSEHDYICRVCDKIVNPDGDTYEILERLGHGTFGQVLKCVGPLGLPGSNMKDGEDSRPTGPIALKIIKNKPAYFHQALVEVHILKMLNLKYDPEDNRRIVRMLDFFVYRKHLCIAFELLSVNLYDVLKQNSFRGVSMALIRVLTEQLLKAMQCLREASVIHCDLKPENVLLSNMQHTRIKLIDFGSACFENHTVYSYIQSRFYRSPEVLLGLPYTTAIDMWSLGCICAELFLGLPIFPGHSEYDQVCRIAEVCGLPPVHMLEAGKCTRKYFRRVEEPLPTNELNGDGELASGSSECGSVESGVLIMQPGCQEGGQRPLQQSPRTDDDWGSHAQDSAGSFAAPEEEPVNGEEKASPVEKTSGPPSPVAPSASPEEAVLVSAQAEPLPAITSESSFATAPAPSVESASFESGAPAEAEAAASARTERAPRSESFIDRLKRTVGSAFIQPDHPPPAAVTSAPAPPSSSGSAGGGTAVSESEGGGDAAGSTVSTAATEEAVQRRLFVSQNVAASASDASAEAPNPQRLAPSADHSEAVSSARGNSEAQSDGGRGEARVSGSSDGGAVDLGQGPHSRSQRRQHTRRRRVRTFWRLKTREEYERDEHKKEPIPKKYFDFKSLEQMCEGLPYKGNMSRRARAEEQQRRHCFLQFLCGALAVNPDERLTPKQANHIPFITGHAYDPNIVLVDDDPVPSFTRMLHPSRSSTAQNVATAGRGVPRLDPEALGQPGVSGGGSARSYKEKNAEDADGKPSSAPSTFRGVQPGGQPASGVNSTGLVSTGTKASERNYPVPDPQVIMPDVPQHAMRGLWGHLCAGVPLPDANPAESYRPPIDKLSEDFFRGVNCNVADAATERRQQQSSGGSPHKSGMSSGASSTGSTPLVSTHAHRKRTAPLINNLSMSSGGSPHANSSRRNNSGNVQQAMPRHPGSGTTGTPGSSSSYGNVSPHGVVPAGGTPIINVQTPQGGVPHTAPGAAASRGTACASGSRDGSRGSSPWHLPSPMSELSTASDRVNSSQPSGSDSCGENLMINHDGGTQSFNEWSGEDPSHSDGHYTRSHQPSDSDGGTMTPNSLRSDERQGTGEQKAEGANKDPRDALWENIKVEMARVELSRDKLPRRLDITQSPGSAGAMGNFREKMGMNERGPVIPFGHGARRDGNAAGAAPGYGGVFTPPYRPTGSGGGDVQALGHNAGTFNVGSSGSGSHGSGSGSGRRRIKNKPNSASGNQGNQGNQGPGGGEQPR